MRTLRVAFLAFLVAIISALLVTQTVSGHLRQGDAQGILGTVSVITTDRPSVGETRISLDTPAGVVELAATATTEVHIPGRESASVASLLVGDPVAVLANGEQALRILVRGTQPVRTRHFTGIVTSIDEDEEILSLRSSTGEAITAPILGTVQPFDTA